MSIQQENHYKERDPVQTVDRLKAILGEMHIEMDEAWCPKSTIGTYSLRVTIKGTNIGSNGKGVSKEYARASAYAEFFERFQNCNYFMSNAGIQDGVTCFPDEKKMSSLEIVQSKNAFIERYYSGRNKENLTLLDKVLNYRKLHRFDFHCCCDDDKHTVLPFYSVKTEKIEYLPFFAYYFYYLSNGMCAGNTPEEAIVQGLSEIIERYVQKRIFSEKLSLPDIPDEHVKKFPYIDNMIKQLMKNDGYTYKLKDCSLGGQFPVAALIAIQKNTGKYGVKFGCHPDFGIAMERTLTEATQGVDITDYTDRSTFDFKNSNVQDNYNIYGSFYVGTAQYPYEILLEQPSYPFVPVQDVSHMSNKEILDSMINQILSMGYDVLVRDVSYLGFPSYHIIVPGMSELQDVSDQKFRAYNTKTLIAQLLNDPSLINKENCRYIIETMRHFAGSQFDESMMMYYCFPIKFKCPGEEFGLGWVYLTAMCYALSGDYTKAAEYIGALRNATKHVESERSSFYNAVYYYLDGMAAICDHKKVMAYLDMLFDKTICLEINNIFSNPDQIITKQYPFHRHNLDGYCHNNNECCELDLYLDCYAQLRKKQIDNPINQADLNHVFMQ